MANTDVGVVVASARITEFFMMSLIFSQNISHIWVSYPYIYMPRASNIYPSVGLIVSTDFRFIYLSVLRHCLHMFTSLAY